MTCCKDWLTKLLREYRVCVSDCKKNQHVLMVPLHSGRVSLALSRRQSLAAVLVSDCVAQNQQSGATVAELIMVDTSGGGVLIPPLHPPPFFRHALQEEESDRKGEVTEAWIVM